MGSDGFAIPVKALVSAALLAFFWAWETLTPYRAPGANRLGHGARNLALALVNTLVLALVFGGLTVFAAGWAEDHRFGLLNALRIESPLRWAAAFVLLDAWLYLWHRANHAVPLLWRFHRVHHADADMDVTTATRFHLGEQVLSATIRLAIIPLLGVRIGEVLLFDAVVVACTQFHHANVSLGRWDRPLRWLIVTPAMHRVHHSRTGPDTHTNFSVLMPLWDRLLQTFRARDEADFELGLEGWDGAERQSLAGLMAMPFAEETDRTRGVPRVTTHGLGAGRTRPVTSPKPMR
jgi:sterol desaturase/sphingolipid hydroxylase (fatty acid hydroxylase superfamily)